MLLQRFLDAGLIQFGLFDGAPMLFSLDMLPAYPDILTSVADEALNFMAELEVKPERIVATASGVPLGVAVSLRSSIPLVYSRGNGGAAVHDLAGAYDIGHPALLVANVMGGASGMAEFMVNAQRVGLQISASFALVDLGVTPLVSTPSVLKMALLHLPTAIDKMVADGTLPVGQAEAVRKWLEIGGRVHTE